MVNLVNTKCITNKTQAKPIPLSRKTGISGAMHQQFFAYRDSNLKIYVQPGLEAQNVEKH